MPSLRYTRSTNRHSRLRSITCRFDADLLHHCTSVEARTAPLLCASCPQALQPNCGARRMPSQLQSSTRATVLALGAARWYAGRCDRSCLPPTPRYRQLLLSRASAILTVIHADKRAAPLVRTHAHSPSVLVAVSCAKTPLVAIHRTQSHPLPFRVSSNFALFPPRCSQSSTMRPL